MKARASSADQLINALADALVNPPSRPGGATDPVQPAVSAEDRQLAERRQRYQFLLNPDWPEARWDVSGAFVYDKTLVVFHDFLTYSLGIKPFARVHGAPLCLWNSGRLRQEFFQERDDIEKFIQDYARRGITLDVTFSSTSLNDTHLVDPMCNYILNYMGQFNPTGGNGVIFCSDRLAAHVRKFYPGLKLVASVVKAAEEDGRGKLDYYRKQAELCDKVMVHPDDNFNLELLSRLENRDKYEILVNETCFRNCPRRKQHYRMLSLYSQNLLDSGLQAEMHQLLAQNNCSDPSRLLLDKNQRTLMLSTNEIKSIYDLGFRNFKIQGRGVANPTAILLEMARLMFNHTPDQDNLSARTMLEIIEILSRTRK
jgi:hypothetical protein